ncbi:thioredoxin-disulfide reductase [Candidatus Woesebacteria bacterium RIFCSPHIGHO2_01_FULL_41_10]|uniref:Thioredoxin reductase n=1 Tax=Candidatus Woesebacteria bacterium RIFCSPHIGHO2_01_FULL_41_10 TaxID=1802500 RepID=A0A1F7YSS2_9BACT|nr:MAG: thioredoxin-disulfide reductase [Candidatus Woesebacteria bacterium RIFCSPHIGHO2_01_FULL_41_10]
MVEDKFFEPPKEGEPWDTLIIGSGPSALTAAIYTTRGASSTIIVAGSAWGGQLMLTTEVDNFPGFPEGIQGPELMEKMRKQAERFGTKIVDSDVTAVDFSVSPYKISVDGKNFTAKTVIVATGAQTKWLNVPGEEKLRGRGVSSCAPCDAPFFKNKRVIVIGGGDAAMEEALVLTKYASSVTIVHRRDSFRASQAMQNKVLGKDSIRTVWNSEVVEFLGDQKLEKVLLKDCTSGKTTQLETDGAFVAVGHVPSTAIFKGSLELDEKGFIKKHERDGYHMATSREGVFVAGDVHDTHYKQAITAAGFGSMAALEVLQYLDKGIPSW